MLLFLHFLYVCIFLTETQSPEEVATDTSGEEVYTHHDTTPDQHVFSHVSLDPPPPTGTDVYLYQRVVGAMLIMFVHVSVYTFCAHMWIRYRQLSLRELWALCC